MGNPWEDDYVQSMENMQFTREQKERMVDFLMKNQQGEKENKKNKSFRDALPQIVRRLAAAGVCLCILAAATAGAHAAGLFKPVSSAFQEILHLNDTTSQITDEIGSSLDASDTSDGATITADAAIGDKYNYSVIFSIQKNDGTKFSQEDINALMDKENTIAFQSFSVTEKQQKDNDRRPDTRRGFLHFYDKDQEDTSIQLLFSCTSESGKNIGKMITVHFEDFGYYDSSLNFIPVLTGKWKLKFQLDYADSAKELAAGQRLTSKGVDITIKKLDLSPIGFHIECVTDGEKITDRKEKAFCAIPVTLTLANGKTMDLTEESQGDSMWPEDGNACFSLGNTFKTIIPMEDMKTLRIGDIDFSLSE